MKISARPLKGDAFDVEVDPETDTVDALKKKIAELKPDFPAEQQKLIYAGKILADGTNVKEYNIKEGDFVVVMVAKAKPPAGGSSEPSAPQAPAAPVAPAPAPAPAPAATAAATLVTGGAMEGTITQLMEMGFPREQVEECLRAAFNNPDRAVEYLMSGIPPGVTAAQQEPAAAPAPAPPSGGAAVAPAGGGAAPPPAAGGAAPPMGGAAFPPMGGAFPAMPPPGGGGGGGGSGALAELRAHPQFEQLRQVVQRNPQALNQVLASLAATHPQLLQQITEHQEEFVQMLQEPAGGQQDPVAAMLAAAQAGGAGGGGQGPPGGGMPPPVQIQLNETERASIEMLMGLGFDRNACLEAFLACDRNEEIAANYLFEHGGED